MAARIDAQGIWKRNIPDGWITNGVGRTDKFKTVLDDKRLRQCCFVFETGPIVFIPVTEMRRVIQGGCQHYNDKIWGPFYIDTIRRTVEGRTVQMDIGSSLWADNNA